jgi:hypothetical protein
MSEGVQTRAWYQFGGLKGFEPGYLLLTPERRLTFVGPDRARFDVPLAEVTGVKFPKHWFDGGCKLTIAGEEHRVDFVRPNGAADVTYQLWEHAGAIGIAADAALVARKFSDIGSGRAAGKKWKQLLTEPATSQAAPAASQAPASDAFPAGWYADPQGQARLRWWDGAQWTARVTH